MLVSMGSDTFGYHPRMKQSDNNVHVTSSYYWSQNGVNKGLYDSHPSMDVQDEGYLAGYDIPNFHKLQRGGALLPHLPFKRFSAKGTSAGTYDVVYSASGYTDRHWGVNHRNDAWVISSSELEALLPSADNSAYLAQACAKIYSDAGHDTLTFISEFRDVVRMLHNLVKRIDKFRQWARRPAGKISSNWMEGRYGWRPLFYDIEDIQKALSHLSYLVKRHKAHVGLTTSYENTTSAITTNAFNQQQHVVTDYVTVGRRGSMCADIEYMMPFQFNPIITALELIPYGFVVDWVWNISSMLASWSLLSLHNGRYTASYGISVEMTRIYNTHVVSWNPGYSGLDSSTGSCTAKLALRIPAAKVSHLPQLDVKLDTSKVLDLLVMIAQLRR